MDELIGWTSFDCELVKCEKPRIGLTFGVFQCQHEQEKVQEMFRSMTLVGGVKVLELAGRRSLGVVHLSGSVTRSEDILCTLLIFFFSINHPCLLFAGISGIRIILLVWLSILGLFFVKRRVRSSSSEPKREFH